LTLSHFPTPTSSAESPTQAIERLEESPQSICAEQAEDSEASGEMGRQLLFSVVEEAMEELEEKGEGHLSARETGKKRG